MVPKRLYWGVFVSVRFMAVSVCPLECTLGSKPICSKRVALQVIPFVGPLFVRSLAGAYFGANSILVVPPPLPCLSEAVIRAQLGCQLILV